MFSERFRLRRNWLQGRYTVRTFAGHTSGELTAAVTFHTGYKALSTFWCPVVVVLLDCTRRECVCVCVCVGERRKIELTV